MITAGTTTNVVISTLDLFATAERYAVAAELPGCDPPAVDLTSNSTVIFGPTRRTAAARSAGFDLPRFRTAERVTYTLARTVCLPAPLGGDRIGVSYAGEVLALTVPPSAATRSRRIPITRRDGAGERSARLTAGARRLLRWVGDGLRKVRESVRQRLPRRLLVRGSAHA